MQTKTTHMGHASELTLDEDGKRHGTVTASGGKAHLTGDLGGMPVTDEIPMGADDVFDCFGAVTPLSIAERVFQLAPGATAVVRGEPVLLIPVASAKPGVKDVSYEITRTADGAHGEHTYDFVGQAPFGKMSGTIVIDTDRHLVSIIYRSSYGVFELERSSPSP